MTYHKDEPANKFITTEEVDDKGQQIADYNEFGEKISENTFIDKTSLVESSTDTNGNKISYGYDVYDDNLLQITTTVDDKILYIIPRTYLLPLPITTSKSNLNMMVL